MSQVNDTTWGSDKLETSKILKAQERLHKKEIDLAFGGNTREVVTNAAWTGKAYAVTFITETTPTVFTMNDTTGTLSGIVYPAGLTIYGPITAITVGAGDSVLLYSL